MIDFFVALLRELFAQDAGAQMAVAPLIIAAGISAATSIGSAIFGSSSAAKQRRQQQEALRRQRQENRNWYRRRYNEDATQTASAQLMMRRVNEYNKKRTQAALGRKNVVGGTDASMAATQQANAEAVGDALGGIVANAESRKDGIESQYRQEDQRLAVEQSGVDASYEATKRQNVANAATGAINAMASVMANSGTDASGKAGTRAADTLSTAQATAGKATSAFKPTVEKARRSLFGKWDGDSVDIWQQMKKTGTLYG